MPSEMTTFILPSGAVLSFTPFAWDTMHVYKQTGWRSEAGGVLLGRVFENGDVTVESVTVPGRGDKRGRFFFDRCRERAQRLVDGAWKKSGGEVVYLGEWHTHPETAANPSSRDKAMIQNMLRETRMELNFLVSVIIGLEKNWIGIRTCEELTRLQGE